MSSKGWPPRDPRAQAAELLLAFAATARRLSIVCSAASPLLTLPRVETWHGTFEGLKTKSRESSDTAASLRVSPVCCHQPTVMLTASLGRDNPMGCWVGLSLSEVSPLCRQLRSPLLRVSLSGAYFFLSERYSKARVFLKQDMKWYSHGQCEICPSL